MQRRPRFAHGGVFEGYVVSCFDITDFKNAQELALSRQKLESLGVLAAGIAHDFNNLLGSIHAEAELAEAELAEGSGSDKEIQAIKKISIRASEIVRQLMIYSGHDRPDFEPLDVSQIVEEMLELLNVSTSKNASLKVDLAKDLPEVMANGPQIRQVVMNLVINASDALANRGGEIRVSTSVATGGPNSALAGRGPPAGGRLRNAAGIGYRRRHDQRGTEQNLRSVLHHEIGRTWTGTGGRARNCRRSPRYD